MMTPTDNESMEAEQKELAADSTAVLEVSSMLTVKQQDDSVSNGSTSVEGSVVGGL